MTVSVSTTSEKMSNVSARMRHKRGGNVTFGGGVDEGGFKEQRAKSPRGVVRVADRQRETQRL
jgi:hypothetical protein